MHRKHTQKLRSSERQLVTDSLRRINLNRLSSIELFLFVYCQLLAPPEMRILSVCLVEARPEKGYIRARWPASRPAVSSREIEARIAEVG